MTTLPPTSPDGFPVDEHGFVRQCAWCRKISDAQGRYLLASATLLRQASHGCCEWCELRYLRYDGSQPPMAA